MDDKVDGEQCFRVRMPTFNYCILGLLMEFDCVNVSFLRQTISLEQSGISGWESRFFIIGYLDYLWTSTAQRIFFFKAKDKFNGRPY